MVPMIRMNFRGQAVAVPGDLISQAMVGALPEWLTGKAPVDMKQALIRTTVKGFLPMLLAQIHQEIIARGAAIPPPDVRCPKARADIVGYAAEYLIGTMALAANQELYVVQGSEQDGVYVVTGLVPARADVVEAPAAPDAAPGADAATRAPAS